MGHTLIFIFGFKITLKYLSTNDLRFCCFFFNEIFNVFFTFIFEKLCINTFQFFSGSLYKGIIPVLQSICASNFVYFYIYNGLKASVKGGEGGKDLILASVAGFIYFQSFLWLR